MSVPEGDGQASGKRLGVTNEGRQAGNALARTDALLWALLMPAAVLLIVWLGTRALALCHGWLVM